MTTRLSVAQDELGRLDEHLVPVSHCEHLVQDGLYVLV